MGFQPSRFLVNPGPIQWGHPLANGLTGAWVATPGALQIRDLLGVHNPTIANGPTAVTGMTGPVLKFAAANARATVAAQSALKQGKTASLFWYGTFDSAGAPSNDTLIHGVSFTNANSSPFVGYAAQRTNADPTRISFGWSNNGTYTEAVSASADMPSYGVPFSFTCTIRMGGSGIIYINDKSSASNTAGTGPLSYGTTPTLYIPGHMANTAGQDNPGSSLAVAYAWNRDLSAQEVGILAQDPFVLIRPRRRVLKAAAASGAMTGTCTVTSGFTGSLTGFGALTGTSAVTSGFTGTLTGTGALTGTSTVTSGFTGSMLALAQGTGTSAALSGATGSLTGSGALSSTCAVTSGATGSLAGRGALSGTSATTSGFTGSLTAQSGAMVGTAATISGATATLTGTGAIIASAASTSGAAAIRLRDTSLGIWDRADTGSATWSAAAAGSGSWAPATPATTDWTAAGSGSGTWTPAAPASTTWSGT